LREFLAKDAQSGYLRPDTFAFVGKSTLPALVDAYVAPAGPKSRSIALTAILKILGHGAGALDPTEQAAVDALGPAVIDCSDEQSYWGNDIIDMVSRLLTRMNPAQRRELLLAKLQTAAYVERPYRLVFSEEDRAFRIAATRILVARASTLTSDGDLDIGLRALGADAGQIVAEALGQNPAPPVLLRRLQSALGEAYGSFAAARGVKPQNWLERMRDMCAEADGVHERIYLLEPSFTATECGLVPRAGSWSRLGGAGPGIPVPLRRDGEPMDHVLTLDLQEVPELALQFPDARAIALYVPYARNGENYSASQLVAVPASATPPAGDNHLFVVPLDVPSAAFDHRAARASALLGDVRSEIFKRSGWALGEPIWIQEDEGDHGLIMQLADNLGLNLGDSGSLYVFKHAIFMRSY
jgi:hypothetical protein